ncbi:hypothetical protein GCM10011614_21720 [Novosphingobium colocasiae]|uniref:Uncharacterized protein n=2 Tax=Novosphingobium colocasiae TaxID=1256513 RepID=A0A918UFZ0_9SPHN|nr:hypothetical protein GCM10011614_21720 [Novosphingobium colocasiae]
MMKDSMSGVAGTWTCAIATPMGTQKGVLEVTPIDAVRFVGRIYGEMGNLEISGGCISGTTLFWQMKLSKPLPMTLDCTALIEGEVLSGHVKAGMFGTMALTGSRRV